MTVRRDSSACLILLSLLVFAALSDASPLKAAEDRLTCLEAEEVDGEAEPLKGLKIIPCIICEPAWKNSLLMYIKIISNPNAIYSLSCHVCVCGREREREMISSSGDLRTELIYIYWKGLVLGKDRWFCFDGSWFQKAMLESISTVGSNINSEIVIIHLAESISFDFNILQH